ncbi:MAG: hypothetical protein ABJB05_03810 [Parafilimonas sp.]
MFPFGKSMVATSFGFAFKIFSRLHYHANSLMHQNIFVMMYKAISSVVQPKIFKPTGP